jgi:hypothetical protein
MWGKRSLHLHNVINLHSLLQLYHYASIKIVKVALVLSVWLITYNFALYQLFLLSISYFHTSFMFMYDRTRYISFVGKISSTNKVIPMIKPVWLKIISPELIRIHTFSCLFLVFDIVCLFGVCIIGLSSLAFLLPF